jgi:large subunit ribosomal protein L21
MVLQVFDGHHRNRIPELTEHNRSRRYKKMSYAVIRTGGKQYRVSPGELLRIESLADEVGSEISFSEVLLTSADGSVQVGTPFVRGATVTARIVQHGKEKKILVFKKKRRKNYRRRRGHRQHFTAVQIKTINLRG